MLQHASWMGSEFAPAVSWTCGTAASTNPDFYANVSGRFLRKSPRHFGIGAGMAACDHGRIKLKQALAAITLLLLTAADPFQHAESPKSLFSKHFGRLRSVCCHASLRLLQGVLCNWTRLGAHSARKNGMDCRWLGHSKL